MKIITSESVFKGHPDKICDQISDAILDAHLEQDRNARVAVETAIKDDVVFVFGEVTTTAKVDYKEVAINKLKEIGYDETFNVLEKISGQSPDIALGVDIKKDKLQGAGDQGMMYGYATNETKELVPAPLALAHKIARKYKEIRETKYLHYFEPDGKCQVSYVYENDKPVRIETIVVSAQTKPGVKREDYVKVIIEEVLEPLIDEVDDIKILINPTGEFLIGGPEADSGLTGRKIIVDTYGGFSHHGGGAFSGKDSSKVDRSAAYYARYVAVSIVKAGLVKRCEVGVAYSIGVSTPVSLYVDSFKTGVTNDDELLKLIKDNFDFSPSNIRKELKLDNVNFRELSRFGHVGRTDLDVVWEKSNEKADVLRNLYEKTKRTA